ncbi:MAG: pirin family protein [Proteiniphilum sp.]
MSNIGLIIEERAANIGNFLVGRLLPFRQKRMVGPFAFIDHMGPATMGAGENLDVLPHPHIGLSTLTYLFEGAIMHRDSLGSEVEITPGAVNWMTAGKGVVHSERTPGRLRDSSKVLHGMQIWVSLPRELEESEPSFVHIPAEEIPAWEMQGMKVKLIAGEAFGKRSPVPVHSRLYLIELKSDKPRLFSPGDELYGESGLYILEGEVCSESYRFGPGKLLVARDSHLCTFAMGTKTTVYLFGGESFPEKRFIDWNFVSSRRDRLRQAKEDWIERRFPEVPGEREYVSYPSLR